jgi:sec-independent protein translocase protein TatB
VVKGSEAQRQDVTPATAEHQASAPAHAPDPVADEQPLHRLTFSRENVRYGGSSPFFPRIE